MRPLRIRDAAVTGWTSAGALRRAALLTVEQKTRSAGAALGIVGTRETELRRVRDARFDQRAADIDFAARPLCRAVIITLARAHAAGSADGLDAEAGAVRVLRARIAELPRSRRRVLLRGRSVDGLVRPTARDDEEHAEEWREQSPKTARAYGHVALVSLTRWKYATPGD